jgi:hypothetical protein
VLTSIPVAPPNVVQLVIVIPLNVPVVPDDSINIQEDVLAIIKQFVIAIPTLTAPLEATGAICNTLALPIRMQFLITLFDVMPVETSNLQAPLLPVVLI